MPATIIPSRIPADADQRGLLANLFASPGLSLLKEVLGARCIESQVAAMNAALYLGDNETARKDFEVQRKQAELYSAVLDVLDDVGQKEDEWFTVKLEPRR